MQLTLLLMTLFLQSCAYVHHTQVGDVVSSKNFVSVPFEVLVSETGINIQEAGQIGKAVIQDKNAGDNVAAVAAIIGLFQMCQEQEIQFIVVIHTLIKFITLYMRSVHLDKSLGFNQLVKQASIQLSLVRL